MLFIRRFLPSLVLAVWVVLAPIGAECATDDLGRPNSAEPQIAQIAEAMTGLEPKARAICNELIDKFIADGLCDAAQQYTGHIPVKVIAHMLGVPETDSNLFIRWIHEILELGITDDAVLMQAVREMISPATSESGATIPSGVTGRRTT
jgi:cytochrome P450